MDSFSPPSLIQYLTTQSKAGNIPFDLIPVAHAICHAAKACSDAIRKAPFKNLLGFAGKMNIQQEDQKKLDIVSNTIFVENLKASGQVAAIISEEMDDLLVIDRKGKYVIAMDPLDGSSNVDLLLDVGSIVAVWKRDDPSKTLTDSECLQPGNKCIMACYVVYSAGTMCVVSIGKGTHGFTLNPDIGEFLLSHSDMQIPTEKKLYSINEGNMAKWDPSLQSYISSLKIPAYSLRYGGAMVADVARILLKGGIFIYPADKKNTNGKLRLMYELIPMSFLTENAGGKATDGSKRILDIKPTSIHQRCPIFLGSSGEVTKLVEAVFKTSP